MERHGILRTPLTGLGDVQGEGNTWLLVAEAQSPQLLLQRTLLCPQFLLLVSYILRFGIVCATSCDLCLVSLPATLPKAND
eukprot:4990423-Amphidinium_carterae.1